ncbi:MAG: hypothetical protein K2K56_02340 [Lachnospiraceae bacterium]|nr:hypothetical protein [Lachnospiraceae bacterium]
MQDEEHSQKSLDVQEENESATHKETGTSHVRKLLIIGIIVIGIVGLSVFLYFEFEESKDDYPITFIYSDDEYGDDHPPVLSKLPLDIGTEIQTMEYQIPELVEVEKVKKGKIRFKVRWSDIYQSDVYYKYDLCDWYEIEYAENKEFEDAKVKEVKETKKIKAGERYITLRRLKGDKCYIRLRGCKDYSGIKEMKDIHYTRWSETYEIEP